MMMMMMMMMMMIKPMIPVIRHMWCYACYKTNTVAS